MTYAEGFLSTGRGVTRPPVVAGILIGVLFLVVLQVAVGSVFALIIPVGFFLGVVVYLIWFFTHKDAVELSLQGNRRVIGR